MTDRIELNKYLIHQSSRNIIFLVLACSTRKQTLLQQEYFYVSHPLVMDLWVESHHLSNYKRCAAHTQAFCKIRHWYHLKGVETWHCVKWLCATLTSVKYRNIRTLTCDSNMSICLSFFNNFKDFLWTWNKPFSSTLHKWDPIFVFMYAKVNLWYWKKRRTSLQCEVGENKFHVFNYIPYKQPHCSQNVLQLRLKVSSSNCLTQILSVYIWVNIYHKLLISFLSKIIKFTQFGNISKRQYLPTFR